MHCVTKKCRYVSSYSFKKNSQTRHAWIDIERVIDIERTHNNFFVCVHLFSCLISCIIFHVSVLVVLSVAQKQTWIRYTMKYGDGQ
jgi:hypothetical protein